VAEDKLDPGRDFREVQFLEQTALVLSLLASWYPARRASRIDPARVLSGGQ